MLIPPNQAQTPQLDTKKQSTDVNTTFTFNEISMWGMQFFKKVKRKEENDFSLLF